MRHWHTFLLLSLGGITGCSTVGTYKHPASSLHSTNNPKVSEKNLFKTPTPSTIGKYKTFTLANPTPANMGVVEDFLELKAYARPGVQTSKRPNGSALLSALGKTNRFASFTLYVSQKPYPLGKLYLFTAYWTGNSFDSVGKLMDDSGNSMSYLVRYPKDTPNRSENATYRGYMIGSVLNESGQVVADMLAPIQITARFDQKTLQGQATINISDTNIARLPAQTTQFEKGEYLDFNRTIQWDNSISAFYGRNNDDAMTVYFHGAKSNPTEGMGGVFFQKLDAEAAKRIGGVVYQGAFETLKAR
ncbi:hypothetical protein [Pelistega europaea]|uniref:Lipoprotein n=1 Tax=Pelistega europaea TaxID=106147 RepID=A0A7Y4LD33_9BURK|nr:hypothetical protein [Pelistega europaea]NOL50021.1 hypothetical protein [Pelistega europaea]